MLHAAPERTSCAAAARPSGFVAAHDPHLARRLGVLAPRYPSRSRGPILLRAWFERE